jgi:TatD DNase family protein
MTHHLHDTHAHLEMLCQKLEIIPETRDDIKLLPEVQNEIQGFAEKYLSNHDWVIHPTVSNKNLNFVLSLFWDISKIYFLLGAHPEIVNQDFNLKDYQNEQENLIKTWKLQYPDLFNTEADKKYRLLGIGEIGLDYFYSQDEEIVKKQKALFSSQIELAIDLNLPIEIHARDAWDDIWKILKNYPKIHGKFLIHCFTGNKQELKNCLDLGGKAAFGGIVTFPKSLDLQEAAMFCPSDSLVLETDLPFLAPVPFRGKTCEPDMIADTAIFMAKLKNTTPEQIWEWSKENSKNLFGV